MRKLFIMVSLLLLTACFIMSSCTKSGNNSTQGNGNITISINASQVISSNAQKSDSVSMGNIHSIVITIADASGKSVINSQQITLYNMSGVYISIPLALTVGNYTLTSFLVLDQNNNVIYAAPLINSTKASLVSNPLPLKFSIQADNVTNVQPEVISANGCSPQEFGYTTFGFNIANNFNFLIGAFIYNSSVNNFQLTSANISIYSGSTAIGTAVYTGTLSGKASSVSTFDTLGITNEITLPMGNSDYTLVVSKSGYLSYTHTFTTTELKKYFYSTDNGPLIVILNVNTSPWITYNHTNGFPFEDVASIAFDASDNVWFGTTQGVIKYDGTSFKTYTTANGLGEDHVQAIAFDHNGNAWFGQQNGATVFDGTNWTNYNISNSTIPARVISIAVDSYNNIWFGTYGGGLTVFDGSNWMTYNTNNSGLKSNFIFSIMFDSQGKMWVTTWDSGSYEFDGSVWTSFDPTSDLYNNNDLAIDNLGNIWIGTVYGGLAEYNNSNWTTYNTSNGFPCNFVYSILVDPQNEIWSGTWGGGLVKLNAGKISIYNTVNSGLSNDSIRAIGLDKKGYLWICTHGSGVCRYNYQVGK